MDIKCRECNEPIEGATSDRDNVRAYHYPECFDKHCESYREYGIRIGARIHKEKKRLPEADGSLDHDEWLKQHGKKKK